MTWMAGAAGISLLLLLFGVFLNLHSSSELHEDYSWANHTHEVIDALNSVLSQATDAEANQRGYVITGDRLYLAPTSDAVGRCMAQLAQVQHLIEDNPVQQNRLILLRQQLGARFKELQAVVDIRRSRGLAAAADRIAMNQGRAEMDKARVTIGDMLATEQQLLVERSHKSAENYLRTRIAGVTSGVSSLIAVAALLVLISFHINSRGKASELVLVQAERLRTTLESIGDAVIVTDQEGRITTLNSVAEALTGWGKEEANGLPIEAVFQIVNEDSREKVENPAARALRDGMVVGLANHTVLIGKDGQEQPIDDSAAPVTDAQGSVSGVVLVFRDVSERRAIDKSQAILASIVEDSDDAIVSKTLDGVIVSWNTSAQRLFNYTAEEAIGQPIQLIIPMELRDEERDILERLKNGQRIDHFETTRVAKNGRLIEVSLTVSPLRDSTGKIMGASKVARDITAAEKVRGGYSVPC